MLILRGFSAFLDFILFFQITILATNITVTNGTLLGLLNLLIILPLLDLGLTKNATTSNAINKRTFPTTKQIHTISLVNILLSLTLVFILYIIFNLTQEGIAIILLTVSNYSFSKIREVFDVSELASTLIYIETLRKALFIISTFALFSLGILFICSIVIISIIAYIIIIKTVPKFLTTEKNTKTSYWASFLINSSEFIILKIPLSTLSFALVHDIDASLSLRFLNLYLSINAIIYSHHVFTISKAKIENLSTFFHAHTKYFSQTILIVLSFPLIPLISLVASELSFDSVIVIFGTALLMIISLLTPIGNYLILNSKRPIFFEIFTIISIIVGLIVSYINNIPIIALIIIIFYILYTAIHFKELKNEKRHS